MSISLFAILTEATCGAACWEAKEDICRCSCGGKNHGCLKQEGGGTRPVRTAKIDGYRYELVTVGNRHEIYDVAEAINHATGFSAVNGSYHYSWSETDHGAPARLKPATKEQIARWPELAAYAGLNRQERYHADVCLIWRRVEVPGPARCQNTCERCDARYNTERQ